ncbi:hypothetical protein NDU88_005410 [Pleurodeles waltl]|uniref:Uncharacterized protein n=1 Tax=Pleurodeles waltl TaxID=8319 RepID=A0AAV7MXF3_PLEWA|nr:hypothetical protein NDU88_005410 [Pleurodeles waltl]
MHRREGGRSAEAGRKRPRRSAPGSGLAPAAGARPGSRPLPREEGGKEVPSLLFNFAGPALHRIGLCRGGELQLRSLLDGEGGGEGGGARLQATKGLRGPVQCPGPSMPPTHRGPALLASSAPSSPGLTDGLSLRAPLLQALPLSAPESRARLEVPPPTLRGRLSARRL